MLFGRRSHGRDRPGGVVVAAGLLLLFSLVHTALAVELLLRDIRTGPHDNLTMLTLASTVRPYDNVIRLTLNWSVPWALTALLIAVLLERKALRTRSFRIGAALIAGAGVGAIWYGHYFVGLLGGSLGDWVWWI